MSSILSQKTNGLPIGGGKKMVSKETLIKLQKEFVERAAAFTDKAPKTIDETPKTIDETPKTIDETPKTILLPLPKGCIVAPTVRQKHFFREEKFFKFPKPLPHELNSSCVRTPTSIDNFNKY
jgi:hypothetical protein